MIHGAKTKMINEKTADELRLKLDLEKLESEREVLYAKRQIPSFQIEQSVRMLDLITDYLKKERSVNYAYSMELKKLQKGVDEKLKVPNRTSVMELAWVQKEFEGRESRLIESNQALKAEMINIRSEFRDVVKKLTEANNNLTEEVKNIRNELEEKEKKYAEANVVISIEVEKVQKELKSMSEKWTGAAKQKKEPEKDTEDKKQVSKTVKHGSKIDSEKVSRINQLINFLWDFDKFSLCKTGVCS